MEEVEGGARDRVALVQLFEVADFYAEVNEDHLQERRYCDSDSQPDWTAVLGPYLADEGWSC